MDMARSQSDASQLSPQDRKELDDFNEARRKQKEAGALKSAALVGVTIPPDPTQPPPQEQRAPEAGPQLTTPGQINLSQQEEIAAADQYRKNEMEKHMEATRAGRNPHAAGSTIDLVHGTGIGAALVAPQAAAAAAVAGEFTIWRAIRQDEDSGDRKMADATLVYADDWSALRTALKTEADGDWLAIHYQFQANVPNILGFFVELKSPYQQPEGAVVEKFDVIVKGAKIFRSEIDPDPVPEPDPKPEPEPIPEAVPEPVPEAQAPAKT